MPETSDVVRNAQMESLCSSFPSLRQAPGTMPWEQRKFALWASGGISHGAQQAAAFVLSVWNGSTPDDGGWWNEAPLGVGRFDVIEAFAIWDYQHQAAFLDWCNRPFWP